VIFRRVKTVVRDGVVYQAPDLDRALGVKTTLAIIGHGFCCKWTNAQGFFRMGRPVFLPPMIRWI